MLDFVRISCCVPEVFVANTEKNTQSIKDKILKAREENVNFLVFPELCVTGYTCGDLFFQKKLLAGAKKAVLDIVSFSEQGEEIIILGAPLIISRKLLNCAVIISKGKIWGIVPKTFIPNQNEFCEKRWFSSADDLKEKTVRFKDIFKGEKENYEIPVGNDLIFETENGVNFASEVCEDLWMSIPPSTKAALSGAEIIFNLSASNEIAGKRSFRQDMVKMQSSKVNCVYAFVSSGTDESTTDLIFSGHSVISENGKIIAENENFLDTNYSLVCDADLGKLRTDRLILSRFRDLADKEIKNKDRLIRVSTTAESDGSCFKPDRSPFVPPYNEKGTIESLNIFEMQSSALAKRLKITGGKAVIGVSGGLDSTLALLVTCNAMKKCGYPMENICAVTMPSFGTSGRTYDNALEMMKALGVTVRNISVKNACIEHFEDIGHDINNHDVTYENAQARERTQVLMDIANQFGGIVVGTGDLSELALGWCTYCGDQMSMYGVNSNVPKTLVSRIVDAVAEREIFPDIKDTLKDVINTPISPELLPPDENGDISQKTEDTVGPYELHDFFLYYVLRYGFSPEKIYFLAKSAFSGEFEDGVILKWLKQFYRRFFSQQFKRSCMPDGVKVLDFGLSPRGDFLMPSDAESALWLSELEKLN